MHEYDFQTVRRHKPAVSSPAVIARFIFILIQAHDIIITTVLVYFCTATVFLEVRAVVLFLYPVTTVAPPNDRWKIEVALNDIIL